MFARNDPFRRKSVPGPPPDRFLSQKGSQKAPQSGPKGSPEPSFFGAVFHCLFLTTFVSFAGTPYRSGTPPSSAEALFSASCPAPVFARSPEGPRPPFSSLLGALFAPRAHFSVPFSDIFRHTRQDNTRQDKTTQENTTNHSSFTIRTRGRHIFQNVFFLYFYLQNLASHHTKTSPKT